MKVLITALVSSAATAAFFLKDKIFGKKKRTKVVSRARPTKILGDLRIAEIH